LINPIIRTGEKIRRERRSSRQGLWIKEVQSRMRRRIEIRRRSKMAKKRGKRSVEIMEKLGNRIEGHHEAT